MYCTFIDFKKAFDTVWRLGLWQKLVKNNITGKILKVIFSMYSRNHVLKRGTRHQGSSHALLGCVKRKIYHHFYLQFFCEILRILYAVMKLKNGVV